MAIVGVGLMRGDAPMGWQAAMLEAQALTRDYGHRYRVEGARNVRGQWRYWIRMAAPR